MKRERKNLKERCTITAFLGLLLLSFSAVANTINWSPGFLWATQAKPAPNPNAVKLPGKASDIDVKNGVVFVIGSNRIAGGYGVWKLVNAGWVPVSGAGVRLAVDNAGTPWVINESGIIQHQVGLGWITIPAEKKAIDIAIDSSGLPWIVFEDGNARVWRDMKMSAPMGTANAWRITSLRGGQMFITTTAKKGYIAIFGSDGSAGASGLAAGYLENALDPTDGMQWAIDADFSIWKVKAK